MSELYSVSVVRVEGDTVDLDVTVVHPDAGAVPDDCTFALRMIWDPIDEYSYGKEPAVKNSPLAKEMDLDSYINEDFIDENAQGFIKHVHYVSEENHPPPRWNDSNYEEFWDSDQSSSAVIRIQATHPGWLSHLRVGMCWDTAGDGTGDGAPWDDRPTRYPGDYIEQVSDDPMAGMRQGEVSDKNKSMFEDAQVTEYVLPCFGAKQYSTKDQEMRGEAITVERVRALLGQPVLIQGDYRLEIGALINVNDEGADLDLP